MDKLPNPNIFILLPAVTVLQPSQQCLERLGKTSWQLFCKIPVDSSELHIMELEVSINVPENWGQEKVTIVYIIGLACSIFVILSTVNMFASVWQSFFLIIINSSRQSPVKGWKWNERKPDSVSNYFPCYLLISHSIPFSCKTFFRNSSPPLLPVQRELCKLIK